MYDLHLHSTYSDGDIDPVGLIHEAQRRRLEGVSLTDHNGIWGVQEAAAAAREPGIAFIAGIEVTALAGETDIHLLGYGRALDPAAVQEGLTQTREGYKERAQQMIRLCHAAGYANVSFDAIVARRSHQDNPCYMAYDVGKELVDKHGLSVEEARRLTSTGGACSVPYGPWALTSLSAIRLIHEAGGVAVLAHPGLLLAGGGMQRVQELIMDLAAAQLDGVEVFHPYHNEQVADALHTFVRRQRLLVTGGSDWHGPGRYSLSDGRFGSIGVSPADFQALCESLP